ncbi:MAG: GntR family transcriptional regulator [Acidobacteria bacterium]|nr:GntR family transcriptional regulator [Acidobacteriota bacterium]
MKQRGAQRRGGSLSPIRKGRLHERVLNAIRDAIYSGHFAPGEALRELRLAGELQVSQGTIREALLRLERTGLVERTSQKETRVVQLSRKQQRDRVELRAILEGIAAVRAAEHMTPADFAELRQLGHEIVRAQAADDLFEVSQADLRFHRFIWRHAQNDALCQVLEMLSAPMFAYVSLQRARDLSRWVGMPHEAVTRALQQGDADQIKSAVASHIERSFEQFLHEGRSESEPVGRETREPRGPHARP